MIQIQSRYLLFVLVAVTTFIPIGIVCIARATENTGASASVIELQKGISIVFAGIEQAKEHLTKKDDFIKNLSPFDRSARLMTDKSVSQAEFLEFVAEQVRPWTVDEKTNITSLIESIIEKLKDFDLNLPPKILLIKTTGAEEGGAAYCRQNAIILPQSMLVRRNTGLEKILIQELFHILSTNDSKIKEALYEVINFRKCDDIELPEKIREIKITNPDGIKNDHYVELQYKDDIINVVPIIYSSVPKYDVAIGGEFFRYLKIGLLAVEKTGDKWRYMRDSDNEPVLLELRDAPDYFNKIGYNTSYIFHPEEILADNFALMVQGTEPVNSKWVIEKMREVFREEAQKRHGTN
jgi:hypothetical protein